ncbi:MAG: hypothetical protein RQ824_07205 [bacterium]|nr:hypothetical protein [bacterium]
MRYRFYLSLLCCISLLIISSPEVSLADQFHYKNLLIGERPAGMAGAYTAVSDTPEGAFYNPAGIAYAVGKSLSVSVNAYHNSSLNYEGVLGGGDWTRESSSLVPNFFGMVQPWGKGKIALSYAVPDIIEEDQNQLYRKFGNVSSLTINLSNIDKTYKIGPSYAQKINDDLAIGVTLYFHYRQVKQIFSQYYLFKTGDYEWQNDNYRLTEYGVEPKIGLMWSPQDKISLGLTLSQNSIIDSEARSQWTGKTDLTPPLFTNSKEPGIASSSDKRDYPLAVSLGGAWFKSESLMVSCDLDYYGAVSSEDRESVLNFSLGTEYYLSEEYALRGGFYTNMANTPEVKSGVSDQNDNVDIYGFTASISRFTRSSAMTFGLNYAYGAGEAQPVANTDIYDATINTLTVFLSGSFNY